MSIGTYIIGIAAAVMVLGVVVELLRRRQLRERHAVLWLVAGVLALIVGIFPASLAWAADIIGIEVPTNLVFFVGIAILFLVCLQHSAELTRMESKTRRLAEESALQELRITRLEQRLAATESPAAPPVTAPRRRSTPSR